MAGLYLEEFQVGHVFRHGLTKTVTESDNMLFSVMTLNPQPLHIDFDFAAKTEWGKPLVNSLFTLGLMIGISVHDTTLGTTIANLGMTRNGVSASGLPRRHDPGRDRGHVVREVEIEAGPRHRRVRAPRLQPERRAGREMHPAGDDPQEGRLMRSLLFVPAIPNGSSKRDFPSGADVVIVDLEDSVAADEQGRRAEHRRRRSSATGARQSARASMSASTICRPGSPTTISRPWSPCAPDGIMLPKSNGGADVQHLAVKLRVHEAENGLADGGIRIIPIITETGSRRAFRRRPIATASPRLAGLTWGAEDLSAAIGARATRDERGRYTDVFRFARAVTILAASAAEVAAIDTVFVNFRDLDGLRAECLEAERDGFTAKMAIHPAQVPVINEAFTPSPEAVARARP